MKNKSTAVRFTSGDYYRPPSARDPRYYCCEAPRYAWVRVLEVIGEIAPSVVKSLAREVFPAYQRVARKLTGFPLTDPGALETATQQPDCPAEFHALKKTLTQW